MTDLSKVSILRVDGLKERLEALEQKTGAGRHVGQVFWSQSNRKEDNPGALPLFTGENVAIEDYTALHNFLLNNPATVTDKSIYDVLSSDISVDCPYYAIDNGRIYLPILRNYLNTVWTDEHSPTVPSAQVYYGWTYTQTLYYGWSNGTVTCYTQSRLPQAGDPVYDENGNVKSNVSLDSVDENNDTITVSATPSGTMYGGILYDFGPWTLSYDESLNINGAPVAVYTNSSSPAVGDTIYTVPGDASETTYTVYSSTPTSIRRKYKQGTAQQVHYRTYVRDSSYDQIVDESGESYDPEESGEIVLHVAKTTLYPWVCYTYSIEDIVTATGYARDDLSNVVTVSSTSGAQKKLIAGPSISIASDGTINAYTPTPDWDNSVDISVDTYTFEQDGWLLVSYAPNAGYLCNGAMYINGYPILGGAQYGTEWIDSDNNFVKVSVGDVFTQTGSYVGTVVKRFLPNKYVATGSGSVIPATISWGSITGAITDQTDLTSYIQQAIQSGVTNMLGRMDFANAVHSTITITINNGSSTISQYEVPENGYILLNTVSPDVDLWSMSSVTDAILTINGQNIYPALAVSSSATYVNELSNKFIPVSAHDIVTAAVTLNSGHYPSSGLYSGTLAEFMFYPEK